MVLSYDAYNETLTNQKAKEDRITVIENQLKTLIATLNTTNNQAHVDKFPPLVLLWNIESHKIKS